MKNQKGEIVTALTLISLGLMVIGALFGSLASQRQTQPIKTKAVGPFVCNSNCAYDAQCETVGLKCWSQTGTCRNPACWGDLYCNCQYKPPTPTSSPVSPTATIPPAAPTATGAPCSGCWEGTTCQPGNLITVCGTSGSNCRNCNDGNLCTTDICTNGQCRNVNKCDDNNPCTTDTCTNGQCTNVAVADGTVCPNGVCRQGNCTAPIPTATPTPSCNELNNITTCQACVNCRASNPKIVWCANFGSEEEPRNGCFFDAETCWANTGTSRTSCGITPTATPPAASGSITAAGADVAGAGGQPDGVVNWADWSFAISPSNYGKTIDLAGRKSIINAATLSLIILSLGR